MKNIFEIHSEERLRIIKLHESATKRLYLKEQSNEVLADINLSDNFREGFWIATQEINDKISESLISISKKLPYYKNQKLVFTITASESQVRNYDKEPSSSTFNKPLQEKELATRRANSVENLLKQYIASYKSHGLLTVEPEIKKVIQLGPTKAEPNKAFTSYTSDEQARFRQEQFVNIKIESEGKQEPYARHADLGASIFVNSKLRGFVTEPFTDTKDISDPGIVQKLNYQDIIFTEIVTDKQPLEIVGQWIIPYEWFNSKRDSPGIESMTENDLNYIKQNFKKIPTTNKPKEYGK